MIAKSILWIRNDQRMADNEALLNCVKESEQILPVYIIDNRLFLKNKLGLHRASERRLRFLGESLRDLISNYKSLGGNVLILIGNPANEIKQLAQSLNINDIYTSAEYTSDEIADQTELISSGLSVKLFHQNTLLHPDDLRFHISDLPNVFTVFRKKVEAKFQVRTIAQTPSQINTVTDVDYDDSHQHLSDLLDLEIAEDSRAAIHFRGGETEALMRLQKYVWETSSIATYKHTRNGLLGENYSSKFSAWLANGNISARTIFFEVQKFEEKITKNESTYWLVFELLWRDFFKFSALKHGSKIFLKNGIQNKHRQHSKNENDLNDWLNAETGNPFIDANLTELKQTGFMSNRGRQNVASYLIHDLNLNWLLGAEFFEHQLIDFDAASNYGNWQYIAGVGCDPKPVRYFDTIWQAEHYDPESEFIKTWLPHLNSFGAEEARMPWLQHPELFITPTFFKPKN